MFSSPARMIVSGLMLAYLPVFTSLAAQDWPNSDLMSNSTEDYPALDEEDNPLRAARASLEVCVAGCLTPTEAVTTAYLAGPERTTRGRFLLDVRGGGADPVTEPEPLFYLNSHPDFRRFGTLIIALEPEVMHTLLNRPQRPPRAIEQGDIVVEARRRRVALNQNNMMKRFGARRILVDGEVGLKWIAFNGTNGREGVPREGYYQVWVRITAPDQVTILGRAGGRRSASKP